MAKHKKKHILFAPLSSHEKQQIRMLLQELPSSPEAALMKKYIQHGKISTYEHVVSVTCLSFLLNERLHLGAPVKELVRGAFLHDFYLYDWHENGYPGRLHGFHHPEIALENANKRYLLTPVEQNIIASHMWPLTLFTPPRSRAAFIVCIADKICSTYETIVREKSFRC